MTGIQLFVGLGNPGKRYQTTRHNAGFWWLDEVARGSSVTLRTDGKFFGQAGKYREHWLLKPETYMNASGQAVAALARFYKIPLDSVLVVHDELDLPPGVCKLKKGGGHGGHNGLRSIIAQLGSNDFWRLRIGIGHPGDRAEVVNFVLNAPGKQERALIDREIERSCRLFEDLTEGRFESAMQVLHSRT